VLEEKAYLAKFIEGFFSLPFGVQTKFLQFASEENDRDDWAKWLKDETLYLKTIRAILFFYTGRDDIKQPSKQDLKKLIADFIREDDWYEHDEKEIEDSMDFLDELGSM
jgi:hypothetical protein